MKILIIGSGGREHALAWKIHQSKQVTRLYCAPGNAGMSTIAECVAVSVDDHAALLRFAEERQIDLTVVGPELPLVNGIVDLFESAGRVIFGPTKQAAQLEGSKIFSKNLMTKYGIPTASYQVFSDSAAAKSYLIASEPPYVIKADGLAAGKGVIIAHTTEDGVRAVTDMLDRRLFGSAGQRIIIEECIQGEELSILAFTDGTDVLPLASSQDHKRAYDNDEGPNTGGMGAYSPCPLVSHDDLRAVVDRTVRPAVLGLKNDGIVYRGLLYAGIMITKKGPSVLEYNVRFGDPETQAVLPRLKDDIVPILYSIARGEPFMKRISWDYRPCISVVMASGGYPGAYAKGFAIHGLDKAMQYQDVVVFHAGTTVSAARSVVTDGGRVLAVSALADSLKDAQSKAYQAVREIQFEGAFYRTDIAGKALQHLPI